MADAGWYPDAHDPNQQHYFDGQNWTGQFRPNPAAPSDDTVRRGDLPAGDRPAGDRPASDQPASDQPAGDQWGQPRQPYGAQAGPQWAQPAPHAAQQPTQQPVQQSVQQPLPQPAQQPVQQPVQQPGYQPGSPYGPAPTQQWAQPGQGAYGSPQWQPAPATPAPSRSRRKLLIIAGVVAAALVAGLVAFLVLPGGDDAPTLTYEGKSISAADATLTSAEKAVDKAVAARKGAKNDDTRCYFAKPKKPASNKKKSDIDDALRCGPVLYVDGATSAAYLSVPVTTTTAGSSVKLEVRDDVTDIEPAALDTALDLERPDGKTAPTENGGAGTLKVPEPPAAEKDVLTTGTLPSEDTIKSIGTKVVGKNLSVTLTRAGEITRYGEGDDARSAPEGQRLVAFQISYGAGDVDRTGRSAAMFAPAGGTPREIPEAGGSTFVIAAMPAAGAAISLTDGGFTQTLGLPAGQPGANSIRVLQRSNRSAVLGTVVRVPFDLRRGKDTGKVTYRATATLAALDFWAPGNTTVHPVNPANAILSVRLNYTDEGKTYGFNPSLLKLRVGTRLISARNVAPSGRINNVFEVPATFTSGVLQISGSTKIAGITLKVKTPRSIPIQIKN